MSAATVEREAVLGASLLRSPQPGRRIPSPRPLRPGRRSGRSNGPTSRPVGAVKAPTLTQPGSGVYACDVSRPVAAMSSTWRLTDRGIATVLVVATMIAVAAVSVIALTAARVTSERFQSAALLAAQY